MCEICCGKCAYFPCNATGLGSCLSLSLPLLLIQIRGKKVLKAGLPWSLPHMWWIFKFLLAIKLNLSSLQRNPCPLHFSLRTSPPLSFIILYLSPPVQPRVGTVRLSMGGDLDKEKMALALPKMTSDITSLLSNSPNSKQEKAFTVEAVYWAEMCCLRHKIDMACLDRSSSYLARRHTD